MALPTRVSLPELESSGAPSSLPSPSSSATVHWLARPAVLAAVSLGRRKDCSVNGGGKPPEPRRAEKFRVSQCRSSHRRRPWLPRVVGLAHLAASEGALSMASTCSSDVRSAGSSSSSSPRPALECCFATELPAEQAASDTPFSTFRWSTRQLPSCSTFSASDSAAAATSAVPQARHLTCPSFIDIGTSFHRAISTPVSTKCDSFFLDIHRARGAADGLRQPLTSGVGTWSAEEVAGNGGVMLATLSARGGGAMPASVEPRKCGEKQNCGTETSIGSSGPKTAEFSGGFVVQEHRGTPATDSLPGKGVSAAIVCPLRPAVPRAFRLTAALRCALQRALGVRLATGCI